METELQKIVAEKLGTLIMVNYTAIGAILIGAFKLIWHLSKADSRIEDAKETAIRAHKRIDKLEDAETT